MCFYSYYYLGYSIAAFCTKFYYRNAITSGEDANVSRNKWISSLLVQYLFFINSKVKSYGYIDWKRTISYYHEHMKNFVLRYQLKIFQLQHNLNSQDIITSFTSQWFKPLSSLIWKYKFKSYLDENLNKVQSSAVKASLSLLIGIVGPNLHSHIL